MTRWDPLGSISQDSSHSFRFGSPRQFQWVRNGRVLLVNNPNDNEVVKYEASTAWEVSGLSEVDKFSVTNPKRALRVHPSESTVIIGAGDGTDPERYEEYAIGNDLDFSSVKYISDASIYLTDLAGPIQWRPDGKEFYYIDYNYDAAGSSAKGDLRRVYDLDRPFRYSHNSNDLIYSDIGRRLDGFYIKNNGEKLYTVSYEGPLAVYSTNTAWDFSSMTQDGTRDLTNEITGLTPQGFTWKPDGSHFYISDHYSGSIYQFDVPTDNKLYSVWETSSVEENVSYDEIFQTEHKQLAYDHENFSEISPDPASCWPLQEKSNKSTAVDVAGDNDLSIASDVSQDRPAIYSRTAMQMPNDTNSSSLNNNSVSNLSKHNFTICLWSKYRNAERENLIDIDEQEIDINRGINGSPIAFTYNTDTITDRTITDGNIYFFSYRYDSSEETMYADAWDSNGNKVATASQTGVTALSEEFANHIQIGSQINGSYNYSSADEIFEVRWYNEKLSETQLEELGSVIWGPKFTQDKQKHSRLTTGPDHARTYKEDEETSNVAPTPDIYMPFHETEGTTAHDIIGVKDGGYDGDVTLGRDGVRGGNAVYLTATMGSGPAIELGSTVHSNGPELELATGTNETPGDEFGSGQLSGGFWYYRTEVSSGDIFTCHLYDTTEGSGYTIREVADGFEMEAYSNFVTATDTNIVDNKWYYIAHNWNPNEVTSQYLYIYDENGLVVSDTNGSSGQQDDGSVSRLAFYYSGGKVCNFRFYNDLTSETSFEKIVESTGGPSYWSGRPVQL